MSERVYLGLGSNLGGSAKLLAAAVEAIAKTPGLELLGQSPVYCSRAIGPPQPDYLNMAVEVRTSLPPSVLLQNTQALERQMGRQPSGERWGPRVIDIDILLYGQQVIDAEGLQVPHSQIAHRNFVLQPLLDLAPGLSIPSLGPVLELLDRCPESPLSLYSET